MKTDKPNSVVYFCAFRYALGRETYMVKVIATEIAHNLDAIETRDLQLMIREIRDAVYEKRAGMQFDVAEWMRLAKLITNELTDRAEE